MDGGVERATHSLPIVRVSFRLDSILPAYFQTREFFFSIVAVGYARITRAKRARAIGTCRGSRIRHLFSEGSALTIFFFSCLSGGFIYHASRHRDHPTVFFFSLFLKK